MSNTNIPMSPAAIGILDNVIKQLQEADEVWNNLSTPDYLNLMKCVAQLAANRYNSAAEGDEDFCNNALTVVETAP